MDTENHIYGVSVQGFIPVRKDPHESSEMVTQILFGEFVEILDEEGKWQYIKCLFDNYTGWIDKKCINETELKDEAAYINTNNGFTVFNERSQEKVFLPAGAILPEIEDNSFQLAKINFKIGEKDGLVKPAEFHPVEKIENLRTIPYLWGGRCGYGIDCSGLTQLLCRIGGKNIPRDASEQSAIGQTLSFMTEAKKGDLAFFDDTEGMIHHVGMILQDQKIIHASGKVRIDRIDQQGIFNEDIGAYTHKLRVVKRVL